MKPRILFISLVLVAIVSTGLLLTYSHVHVKKAAVSDEFPGKDKAPKNDLMLWESLSSHLLSLN